MCTKTLELTENSMEILYWKHSKTYTKNTADINSKSVFPYENVDSNIYFHFLSPSKIPP